MSEISGAPMLADLRKRETWLMGYLYTLCCRGILYIGVSWYIQELLVHCAYYISGKKKECTDKHLR